MSTGAQGPATHPRTPKMAVGTTPPQLLLAITPPKITAEKCLPGCARTGGWGWGWGSGRRGEHNECGKASRPAPGGRDGCSTGAGGSGGGRNGPLLQLHNPPPPPPHPPKKKRGGGPHFSCCACGPRAQTMPKGGGENDDPRSYPLMSLPSRGVGGGERRRRAGEEGGSNDPARRSSPTDATCLPPPPHHPLRVAASSPGSSRRAHVTGNVMRATLAAGARGGIAVVPGQAAVVRKGPQLPPPHHRC